MRFLTKKEINKPQKEFRKNFKLREVTHKTCNILTQSRYSAKLDYYLFTVRYKNKFYTEIKNRCIFSNLSRSVNTKLKVSRFVLLNRVDSGNIVGFYRAV